MQRTLFLAVALVALAIGCSSGPKIYQIHGTVTYDGKPLPKGVIYFDPEPGNISPQGHALINEGAYTTTGPMGQGVHAGVYVVRIEGFDGKPGRELPMGRPMFTDFSENRTFEAKDQEQNFNVPKK